MALSMKKTRLWTGVGLYLLAGCGVETPRCRRPHGEHSATVRMTDCASPVLLCTAGVINDSGFLLGTTQLIGEQLAPRAGLGEGSPETTMAYTGTLTITTKTGALHLRETGLFDTAYPGGLFTSMDVVEGGTGRFAGAAGYLTFRGTGLSAFVDEFSGEICLAP